MATLSSKSTTLDVITSLNVSLKGKNVIVTGGNAGIGKEAARAFALAGASVVLACRDTVKGKIVAANIEEATKQRVEVQPLDLASFDSIKSFAKVWAAKKQPVHVLVLNAALISGVAATAKDSDCELQYAVAHLGHFLLTNLLLDSLKAANDARIITVSSDYHQKVPFRVGLAGNTDVYKESAGFMMGGAMAAYCHAKSCNVVFGFELARRLAGTPSVASVVVHPGWVGDTEINRDFSWVFGTVNNLFAPKTPEQGAATVVYAAVAPQVASGKYYVDCAEGRAAAWAHDEEYGRALWDLSLKQCLLEPERE